MGLDAGINSACALLNLNGQIIYSSSQKEANESKIVELISSIGIPLIVASDTSPPSHFVEKVAARFNVKVFSPKKSLTKEEKRLMAGQISDPHIRDSLAAAKKAYRKFENKLRQIDATNYDASMKKELKKFAILGKRLSDLKSL